MPIYIGTLIKMVKTHRTIYLVRNVIKLQLCYVVSVTLERQIYIVELLLTKCTIQIK